MATSTIHRKICITNESYQEALKKSENMPSIDEIFDLKSVRTATNEEIMQMLDDMFDDWNIKENK